MLRGRPCRVVFLGREGEQLPPDKIKLAAIVVIVGTFLTRHAAIARGGKGWRFA
jgi:hypothetical protein